MASLTCQAKQPVLGANIVSQCAGGKALSQEPLVSRRDLVAWAQLHLSLGPHTCPSTAEIGPRLSTLLARPPGGISSPTSPRLHMSGTRPRGTELPAPLPHLKALLFLPWLPLCPMSPPGRGLSKHSPRTVSDLQAPDPLPGPLLVPPSSSPEFLALSLPGGLSPYLSRVYLCLFSRQAVCSGGFPRVEVLTGGGCGEDTLCPFLSLIGKTEVTAQASGWNFALDDLALFAGASAGTARVKPVRKQAPACWLACSSSRLSSRPPARDLQETPRERAVLFLGTCRNRAGLGGQGGGKAGMNHDQHSSGDQQALLRPPRGNPRGLRRNRAPPSLLPSGAPRQACACCPPPTVHARNG